MRHRDHDHGRLVILVNIKERQERLPMLGEARKELRESAPFGAR